MPQQIVNAPWACGGGRSRTRGAGHLVPLRTHLLLRERWFAYQSFVGNEFDGPAGLASSVGVSLWPFLVTGIEAVPVGLRLRTLRRVRLGRA